MIRVRHYTRVSAAKKIMSELRIIARDQNKVFVERASARRLSPADAEAKYGLILGKGNAYMEFDVEEDRLKWRKNASIKGDEWYINGNVDLTSRNPTQFLNR